MEGRKECGLKGENVMEEPERREEERTEGKRERKESV